MAQAVDISGAVQAFNQLGQARSVKQQRRKQERAERAQKTGAMVGLLAGGATFAATGNPALAGLAASGGQMAGTTAAGGPAPSPTALGQLGLGVAGVQQQQAAAAAAAAQQAEIEKFSTSLEGGPQPPQVPPTAPAVGGVPPGAIPSAGVPAQPPGALPQQIQAATQPKPLSPGGLASLARGGFPVQAAQLHQKGLAAQRAAGRGGAPGSGPFGTGMKGRGLNLINQFNDQRRQGQELTPRQREQDIIARQIVSQETLFRDDAGNTRRIPGLTPPAVAQPGEAPPPPTVAQPQAEPEIVVQREQRQLPTSVRESIQSRKEGLALLDTMKENIGKTGKVRGLVSTVGAFFGTDKGAIEFQQASGKYRISMQSTLKGTPSDKDQKLIDRITPALTDSEEVAEVKIREGQRALNAAQNNEFDYLRKNNFAINEALDAAGAPATSLGRSGLIQSMSAQEIQSVLASDKKLSDKELEDFEKRLSSLEGR